VIRALDHVIIGVADLAASAPAYARLLGREPSWRGRHPGLGTANVLYRLDNTYLELLAADGDGLLAGLLRDALGGREERPFGLALGVDDVDVAVDRLAGAGIRLSPPGDGSGVDENSGRRRTWRSAMAEPDSVRGLRLLLIHHRSPPEALPMAPLTEENAGACTAVDHAVIFTADLEAAARLWQRDFSLAEDWRRDFPERRTRNLGLSLGDTVVELITRTDKPGKPALDSFWGIAYRSGDLPSAVARLRRAGIECDEPRVGLAPGTRVVTVRWSRTPTLLIARD
jgi:catechol 2,3-dioxygenase-like lactoylglutathione lyase family enzyme